MNLTTKRYIVAGLAFLFLAALLVVAYTESAKLREESTPSAVVTQDNKSCVSCHANNAPALVKEWERSAHGRFGVGCADCHKAEKSDPDAWEHEGAVISTLVTPKDCATCHVRQYEEFSRSHHAKAGEILASLDNVLADKVAGSPGNNADAVNGCWQCHGAIVKLKRDAKGNVLKSDKGQPVIDPETWPNSGVGRLNLDGSKGSCHACHSRHSFDAKLSRQPENCGKCHMGPDHPQIEIYNESKHGIAYNANKDIMALNKKDWVLGKDYSAAPTCTTCHTGSYTSPQGTATANSHDVGNRISWTLRPVVSTRLNQVIFEDGFKEDYPESRPLPKVGETVQTSEKQVKDEKLVTVQVARKVAKLVTWKERRKDMKGVCYNCHNSTFVKNFYTQFDSLVELYNEKFAKPAKGLMDSLAADGVLNAKQPFSHEVQWVYWELWHHEGRRARHGASMMGPDYTHWHGMYEVSKHFYEKFLPAVVKAARTKGPEMAKKYQQKVDRLMAQPEHLWEKGLSAQEAEALQKSYKKRYNE